MPFLNYRTSKHPNIHFTDEIEGDNKLPFLNIEILCSNGEFATSVYRKPTFASLFTNFDSFVPLTNKKGLIFAVLFRIFNFCSSYTVFDEECLKVELIMMRNGYPEKLFEFCNRNFLDKVFRPPLKPLTVPKRIVYFTLPFTGKHSM